MKKFGELLAVLDLLEENMETRAKAKDFKAKMGPLIKRVRDAQIGDGRRYAYMMVWPFLRDVLGIEEMAGQDTPVNSALIQRKLEELADAGRLPEDAGTRFEQYALEEYDNFVNQKSITRPKHRGEEVGFSEDETASERAARVAAEREAALRAPAEEPGFNIGVDIEEVDQEFRSVVSDIKDSLDRRSSTAIIEIFFDPSEGPIVQKQAIARLFGPDELADDIEINADKIVIELKPDSKLTKQIKLSTAEEMESKIERTIERIVKRNIKVIVHEPEPGGTYEPRVPDPAPKADIGASTLDRYYPESYRQSTTQGTFPVDIPGKGTFMITMQNGQVVDIECDTFDCAQINKVALGQKVKKGMKIKDALISSFNTYGHSNPPVQTSAFNKQVESVQGTAHYIPESWKVMAAREEANSTPAPTFQTNRERFKPKTNHQLEEYRRMMGTYAQR